MGSVAFPEVIIQELAVVVDTMDGIETVLLRPLRPTDPNGSFGFNGAQWQPAGQGMEIGRNLHPSEGTKSKLKYSCGTLTK